MLERWGRQVNEARARYEEARRKQEDARLNLEEAQRTFDLAQSSHEERKSKQAQMPGTQQGVRQRLQAARRMADQARTRGTSQSQAEAEVRRLEDEYRHSAPSSERLAMDFRRQEFELRLQAEDISSKTEEAEGLAKEVAISKQELERLLRRKNRGKSKQRSSVHDDFRPLSVTDRAVPVLNNILDNMRRGPYQGLRLVAGSGGKVTLVVDSTRQGDQVVRYQGTVVLLIESPIPMELWGTPLDVIYTPGVPTIVLHR